MKSKLKKIIIPVLIVLISIAMLPFLAFGTLLLTVPISRSDEAVRNYVLRQVPMETSWEYAIEIIDKKGWLIKETSDERGLRINDAAGNASFASEDEMRNGAENAEMIRIVGVKAMFVELGEYYGPFHCAVFAYMAFDENDELIEVTIRRDIDSI